MPVTNPKQPNPRTKKTSRYAKARVKSGLTVRALCKMGFGMATVSAADSGKLPRHHAIKAAYLRAIGLGEKSVAP